MCSCRVALSQQGQALVPCNDTDGSCSRPALAAPQSQGHDSLLPKSRVCHPALTPPRSGQFPPDTHSVRSQSPCSATKSADSRRQALMSGSHHLRSCQCQCAIHIQAPGASSPRPPFSPASFVWLCGSSGHVTSFQHLLRESPGSCAGLLHLT